MRYFNFRREKEGILGDRRVNIAVAGACSAAGSTHLTLMLANFFVNVCGLRTVAVESNGQKDFLKIYYETDRRLDDYREFDYKNITFVAEDTKSRRLDRAAAVIYDCGYSPRCSDVFRLADVRIVVLSASVHRVTGSKRFIDELDCDCVYTCAFGADSRVRELAKRAGVSVARIPFEQDPFVLSERTIAWINDILRNISKCRF